MAKLLRFYRERCSRWKRLDEMLADSDFEDAMTGRRADELYRLYRLASCDLAYMQTHTGNPALLDYLEDLVARVHARLTPPSRRGGLKALFPMLRNSFPAVVRREKTLLLLSLAVFLGGAAFGALVTVANPASAETFLAAFPNLLEQSPAMDAARRSGTSIPMTHYIGFSLSLFFHNFRIALMAFAFGLTFGIGTAVLLFANGAVLGCCAIMYYQDGVFDFFLSWVGPHGALELPAIILSGMAGFMLARAELAGGGAIWRSIHARRADILAAIAGIGFMLLVAGCIEGGFSQTHSSSMIGVKIMAACCLFLGLLAWLFLLPPEKGNE